MKLSIIVLCYNFEKFIEQCLLSIISQRTNFDFEILIRDDFSSDKSASIIERIKHYNSNIHFIKGEKNIGFFESYKQLIELSKGEYIAYTDGDDYWTDNYKLQKQCDFLDSNHDYMMCSTGYWQKNSEEFYQPTQPNLWLGPRQNQHDGNFNVYTEHLLVGNPAHFGRVFRKNPTSLQDYMVELQMLDWPINFELSLHGKIKYMNFPAGVYRKHPFGITNSLDLSDVGIQIKNKLNERFQNFTKKE